MLFEFVCVHCNMTVHSHECGKHGGTRANSVFIWVLFRLKNLKYSFKRSYNFFHNDDIHIPLKMSNFCATFDSKKTIQDAIP